MGLVYFIDLYLAYCVWSMCVYHTVHAHTVHVYILCCILLSDASCSPTTSPPTHPIHRVAIGGRLTPSLCSGYWSHQSAKPADGVHCNGNALVTSKAHKMDLINLFSLWRALCLLSYNGVSVIGKMTSYSAGGSACYRLQFLKHEFNDEGIHYVRLFRDKLY